MQMRIVHGRDDVFPFALRFALARIPAYARDAIAAHRDVTAHPATVEHVEYRGVLDDLVRLYPARGDVYQLLHLACRHNVLRHSFIKLYTPRDYLSITIAKRAKVVYNHDIKGGR